MKGKDQDRELPSADTAFGHALPHPTLPAGHWQAFARIWEHVGPPLRPSAEDIAFLNEAIGSWARNQGAPRALILGVTPELYHLPWPDGTDVVAVDHTQSMIDAVWPGPRNRVICADWTAMPLSPASRDIALCDGGIHLLPHPDGQEGLMRALQRVVAPGGLCIFRLFLPPQTRETVDDVLQDLLEAKIPNLNLLKLRLWMALHQDSTEGVPLRVVWDTVRSAARDFDRLAAQIGWPLEHLLTINAYRDSPTRYFFVSLPDVHYMFCEKGGGFTLEAVCVPTYERGECCPTVVLRRA